MKVDMGEAEPSTDQPAIAEQLFNLVWSCIRSYIEVFRLTAEQQVADSAAYEVGIISLLLQPVQHTNSVVADPLAGNGMFRTRNDDWLYWVHEIAYYHREAGDVKGEVGMRESGIKKDKGQAARDTE